VGPDNDKCIMLLLKHYFKTIQPVSGSIFVWNNSVFSESRIVLFWCHYWPVHWVISTNSFTNPMYNQI